MRLRSACVLLVMLALVAGTSIRAQGTGTTALPPKQVISASPLLWIFKWYNVDYEHKMSPTATWGISGSYFPRGDVDYGRASFLVRYYPQGKTLTGFFLGAQTGAFRIVQNTCTINMPAPPPPPNAPGPSGMEMRPPCDLVRQHQLLYGAGVDLGYAWLLGANRNVSVSVGLGLSRVFAGDRDGILSVIPNARLLNVGIAF